MGWNDCSLGSWCSCFGRSTDYSRAASTTVIRSRFKPVLPSGSSVDPFPPADLAFLGGFGDPSGY